MKRFPFYALVLTLALFSAGASAAENIKLDSGKDVTANPDLIFEPGKKFSLPKDASVQEQLNLIAGEINRLRAAASRAVLIFQADMELNKKIDLKKDVLMTLSGGKLQKPLTCKSDSFGMCVFVVEPLELNDTDYQITLSAKKYVDSVSKFRVDPGAVSVIPVHLEMTVSEREIRIPPPPLQK